MPEKILKPAIGFFNRLSFRYKMITIFSILSVLLLLPSITTGINYLQKVESYQKQYTALSYIQNIHRLITLIQLHRGMLNSHMQKKEDFRSKILTNEIALKKSIQHLKEIDKTHGFAIISDTRFQKIITKLDKLYLGKISSHNSQAIFELHTEIISNLIHLIGKISDIYAFGNHKDIILNHLALALTNSLLQLQEMTGRLRGVATPLINVKHLTKEERNKLLSLYIHITSLTKQPINKAIAADIEQHFPHIAKEKAVMLSKLDHILNIIREHIVDSNHQNISNQRFFVMVTETIDAQTNLYNSIASAYAKHLKHAMNLLYRDFALVFVGFMLIMLAAIYLGSAFYHSVLSGVEKLKKASDMITQGKTKIHLVPDSEDEIAHTLQAFNRMSDTLDKNISFLNSYKFAIDRASIVSKTDINGTITYVNERFCQISGYRKEELLGETHRIIHHPDTPDELFKHMWQTINDGRIWHGKIKNRSRSQESYIVDSYIVPIFDNHNEIAEFIAISHDITELEKSKEKIRQEMQKQLIDPLTHLPKRSQLIAALQHMKKPVLLYFDIDNFSALNDFYGTYMGDRVLQYVAKLLRQKLPHHPHIYKVQSNGFAVAFEEEQLPKKADLLIEELIDFIECETKVCDASICVSITLSGGITDYRASVNYDNLLSYLITARKMAKNEHKKFLTYSDAFNKDKDYKKNIEWINKIKEALHEDRIVTFFQPIVDAKNGEVCKYESLVRLIEPSGRVVSPFFFLDIAKKAKLYTKITKVVFDKTFAAFANQPAYQFSINISFEDIADDEIAAYIKEKICAFPDPERIILEITESEQIENQEKINKFIHEVKTVGVKIAIDDFGSGYSNFDHILTLSADYIKIDGTLIKNITESEESRIITEAIIAFSKKLGAKTVVEFVHNEAVYEMVRQMGADFAQGYFLGEPNPYLRKTKRSEEKQEAEGTA